MKRTIRFPYFAKCPMGGWFAYGRIDENSKSAIFSFWGQNKQDALAKLRPLMK